MSSEVEDCYNESVKRIFYLGLMSGILEEVEEDEVEKFIECFKNGTGYSNGPVIDWLRKNLKGKFANNDEKETIKSCLKYCRHRITKHHKSMVNLEKLEMLIASQW
jgi:hypothetical protein